MTKLLSLCLFLSVVIESNGDVIVKDGHYVVVVEYDGENKTNTRVLTTPPSIDKEREHHTWPGELICDAISNDQTVEETVAHEAIKKYQNVWETAKFKVRRLGTVVTVIGSVVSLMGIAAAYGMCVWVTVVSSYLLATVLGRQQYSVVQRKLYPVYFKAISVGILIGLLGYVISRWWKVFTDAVEMWQAINLLSSILMVEANASFVEPRVTKVMFERLKVEKEEGRGLEASESQSNEAVARAGGEKMERLNERLSRLNTYSSQLNLLTLMSLTWHFVYIGHRLSLT